MACSVLLLVIDLSLNFVDLSLIWMYHARMFDRCSFTYTVCSYFSLFAQLFYWMLESKHPLLLFGIPGVVLFILGYRLSGNIVGALEEINSTSIGVTLATIAMTLIGLFSIMVALILYIMGKQVEQVQSQYDWPSRT